MKYPDEHLKRALLIQTRLQAEFHYVAELWRAIDDERAKELLHDTARHIHKARRSADEAVNRLRLPHNT